MNKAGIVTDSTNMIPPELIQEYGIQVVSQGFILDNKVYRDFHEINSDEFWKLYPTINKQPTTRAAAPGDFCTAFCDLAQSTDNIICITLSQALSATFDAAKQAANLIESEQPGIKIRVIDSKTCQGALGFIALEAARAARAGKDVDEIVTVVHDLIPRVKYIMVMDAIEYLIRIGRAPKELAQNKDQQVKPILGMVNNSGVVENLGKAETVQEAIEKMADMVGTYIDIAKPVHAMFHYPNRTNECEQLRSIVTSKYNCTETYMSTYTPSMIAAAGIIIGVSFYS